MEWRFSLFVVGLLAFLAFWTWAPDSPICKLEFVKQTIETVSKDGAASCIEFWFNRYQTLIGAVAAIGAAAAAWFASQGQIAAAEHQAEIGRQQYAAAALPVLNDILQRLNEAETVATQLTFSIEEIKTRITRIQESLSDAYDKDDRQIDYNFSKVIFRMHAYDESLRRCFTDFEDKYNSALITGTRLNIDIQIFTEFGLLIAEADRIKKIYVYAHFCIGDIFEACKRGEIEEAKRCWLEFLDDSFDTTVIDLDRPLLREARQRSTAKVNSIVSQLVN